MLYAAYPYRGQETPVIPLLGRAMRRGVDSLPTLDLAQQDRAVEDQHHAEAGADSHR
jgi:hypothetical protein